MSKKNDELFLAECLQVYFRAPLLFSSGEMKEICFSGS